MYCNCKRDFSRWPSLVFSREITVLYSFHIAQKHGTGHLSQLFLVAVHENCIHGHLPVAHCRISLHLAWCSLPQSLLFPMTFKYYKKSKTLCSQGFATSKFQHQLYVWARKHSETLFLFNGRVSVYVCLSSIWGSGATNYKKIWKIIKNDGHVLPKLIQKFFIFFQALILTFSQCRLRLMSKPWTKCTIWWSTLEACELCGFQRPPCLEYLGTIIQIKWSSIKHRPRMSLQVCMNIH